MDNTALEKSDIIRRFKMVADKPYKDQKDEIKVMCELCSCDKEEMIQFLESQGFRVKQPGRRKAAIINQDFEDAVQDMIRSTEEHEKMEYEKPVIGDSIEEVTEPEEQTVTEETDDNEEEEAVAENATTTEQTVNWHPHRWEYAGVEDTPHEVTYKCSKRAIGELIRLAILGKDSEIDRAMERINILKQRLEEEGHILENLQEDRELLTAEADLILDSDSITMTDEEE